MLPRRRALLHRFVPVLLAALALACATATGRAHDAHVVTDTGAPHDAFAPTTDAAIGMDAAPDVDVATANDAAVVDDAGHDAAATIDAGHDAAVVLVDAAMLDAGSTGCATAALLVSEVRSRGAGGASDEFVELYNPTSAAVMLDATWQLMVRSSSATTYATRWTGTGRSIPAHGHFLIVGAGYSQTPAMDEALSSGITDASSLRLVHAGATVDALCYAFDAASAAAFDATYTCEGSPFATQPHDNTAATNTDASIERRPGGAAGNCTDTGDNASDFVVTMPAAPQDAASPVTP